MGPAGEGVVDMGVQPRSWGSVMCVRVQRGCLKDSNLAAGILASRIGSRGGDRCKRPRQIKLSKCSTGRPHRRSRAVASQLGTAVT